MTHPSASLRDHSPGSPWPRNRTFSLPQHLLIKTTMSRLRPSSFAVITPMLSHSKPVSLAPLLLSPLLNTQEALEVNSIQMERPLETITPLTTQLSTSEKSALDRQEIGEQFESSPSIRESAFHSVDRERRLTKIRESLVINTQGTKSEAVIEKERELTELQAQNLALRTCIVKTGEDPDALLSNLTSTPRKLSPLCASNGEGTPLSAYGPPSIDFDDPELNDLEGETYMTLASVDVSCVMFGMEDIDGPPSPPLKAMPMDELNELIDGAHEDPQVMEQVINVMKMTFMTKPTAEGNTILHVSPGFCDLTQYTTDELIGKGPSLLHYVPVDEERERFISQCMAEKKRAIIRVELCGKDGIPLPIYMAIMPLSDNEGNEVLRLHVCALIIDA